MSPKWEKRDNSILYIEGSVFVAVIVLMLILYYDFTLFSAIAFILLSIYLISSIYYHKLYRNGLFKQFYFVHPVTKKNIHTLLEQKRFQHFHIHSNPLLDIVFFYRNIHLLFDPQPKIHIEVYVNKYQKYILFEVSLNHQEVINEVELMMKAIENNWSDTKTKEDDP
jgi:hypothetical protein